MQLFADLSNGASVEHVQLKSVQMDEAVRLEVARDAFIYDAAQAIQIRYRFEQELWCDTIMPGTPTTRIIRTRVAV